VQIFRAKLSVPIDGRIITHALIWHFASLIYGVQNWHLLSSDGSENASELHQRYRPDFRGLVVLVWNYDLWRDRNMSIMNDVDERGRLALRRHRFSRICSAQLTRSRPKYSRHTPNAVNRRNFSALRKSVLYIRVWSFLQRARNVVYRMPSLGRSKHVATINRVVGIFMSCPRKGAET